MNLKYPGNAQFLALQIITILNIDVLDPNLIYDLVGFDFSYEDDLMKQTEEDVSAKDYAIITQVQDMDFQSFNPIMNIGGLFVVILIIIA